MDPYFDYCTEYIQVINGDPRLTTIFKVSSLTHTVLVRSFSNY